MIIGTPPPGRRTLAGAAAISFYHPGRGWQPPTVLPSLLVWPRLVAYDDRTMASSLLSSIGRRVLPGSLFGRLFLSICGISLSSIVIAGLWFWTQAFTRLDEEANRRLLSAARLAAAEIEGLPADTENGTIATATLIRLVRPGSALGWIQNAYCVDVRPARPRFLALAAAAPDANAALLPPTPDDIEDLLDDALPSLDAGRPAFPDPRKLGGGRHVKIVLLPMTDSDGLLGGVIGLEADMRYLDLSVWLTNTMLRLGALTMLVSIVTAWLLARGLSRRVERLLIALDQVGRRQAPTPEPIGIRELETLRLGLERLGDDIRTGDRRVREIYEEKLSELSFTGAAIAHEIRNPLAAAELHLGLWRRRLPPGSPEIEAFGEISGSMQAIKTLTDRFLDYSRRAVPKPTPLDLGATLADWLASRQLAVERCRVDARVDRGTILHADPLMLRQILDNLLNNALEARATGLVVTLTTTTANGSFTLYFCDNGPGIPPDLVDSLFTPFASRRPGGHGIGLALVRKLVEAHLGTIHYRAGTDGGAGFVITLPEPRVEA